MLTKRNPKKDARAELRAAIEKRDARQSKVSKIESALAGLRQRELDLRGEISDYEEELEKPADNGAERAVEAALAAETGNAIDVLVKSATGSTAALKDKLAKAQTQLEEIPDLRAALQKELSGATGASELNDDRAVRDAMRELLADHVAILLGDLRAATERAAQLQTDIRVLHEARLVGSEFQPQIDALIEPLIVNPERWLKWRRVEAVDLENVSPKPLKAVLEALHRDADAPLPGLSR